MSLYACMFIRIFVTFFILEAFEANYDVLMFLMFHKCLTIVLPVIHFHRGYLSHEATAHFSHFKSDLNGIKNKVGLYG